MSASKPDGISGKATESAARRTRLREFQSQLLERMQAARAGADARISQLGVVMGGQRWLLDLTEASEIVPYGAISPVPLTHDWYLGLYNLRGSLLSVIDFARFLGMPPTVPNQESRIIAFAPGLNFNSGLLVSRVLGLRNVAEMELQANTSEHAQLWSSHCYRDQDNTTWTVLDLSLVVQDNRFLHVGL
ncbi:chemotaxis protein CheW [Massilia sp. W12]|uniref:chemotaxis protein CheW n=1 Tax=Massilia sp. W12 TaxID=3126507 RepID=UPI0030D36547